MASAVSGQDESNLVLSGLATRAASLSYLARSGLPVVSRKKIFPERDLRNKVVTQHFKALTTNCHESSIADHVFLTNHRIKWDHFKILATGRSDMHCKIKESLLICDLKPALNENVGSEKLYLYY